MTDFIKITIIEKDEYIGMFKLLKRIAFEQDGIIYGKYILMNIYNEIHKENNKIDSINIFLKSFIQFNLYMEKLRILGFVVYQFHRTVSLEQIITHSINLTYTIYEMFNNNGIKLNITMKISYPLNIINDLLPPFNNLMLITDALIETKDNILISSNTGTKIDKYNKYEKIVLMNTLYNLIKNKKNKLITNHLTNDKENNIILKTCKYIRNKWKIINNPQRFKKVNNIYLCCLCNTKIKYLNDYDTNNCCSCNICFMNINI